MGKIIVVVGGQFGSEGKGMIAGYLSQHEPAPLMAMRVAGPNAGHTVWHNDIEYKFRALPVASVMRPDSQLAIAAGSEVDIEVLREEVGWFEDLPNRFDLDRRLTVDRQATWLEPEHRQMEQEQRFNDRMGSTAKGIGAARMERLARRARLADDCSEIHANTNVGDTEALAREHLATGGTVLIEGTQGYGLGLHAGYYPFCTSSDCRAVDFLAMCGLSPWAEYVDDLEVWVVLRTYPIRVAGNSGPLADEVDWDYMAQVAGVTKPERTTVTNKIRRIGSWDWTLALRAIEANGGSCCKVALTFGDYLEPGLACATGLQIPQDATAVQILADSIEHNSRARVEIIGTGPTTVIDRRRSLGTTGHGNGKQTVPQGQIEMVY